MRSAGQIVPVLAELAAIGTAHRLPWRIAETNSIYAGGRPGVSDTLGAALWGAELMFQIAAVGGAGSTFTPARTRSTRRFPTAEAVD